MRVEFEFPAVVRTRPPRASGEKHVLCRARGTGDIKEVSEHEAPVAAVIHRLDGKSRYRTFEGNLYASIGRFSILKHGERELRLLRRTNIERTMLAEAAEAMSDVSWSSTGRDAAEMMLAQSSKTISARLPSDQWMKIGAARDSWNALTMFDDLAHLSHGEEDLSLWSGRVSELLDGVMICGETAYVQVPDPCLFVTLNDHNIETTQRDAALFEDRHREPSFWSGKEAKSPYWWNISDMCFPIYEWEEAKSMIKEIRAKRSRGPVVMYHKSEIVSVEMFDPSAFTFDFRTAELRRLADKVLFYATERLRVPSRPKAWLKNADEEVIDALLEIEAARSEDGSLDGIEDALDLVSSVMVEKLTELQKLGVPVNLISQAIEHGLSRWDDRPIEISGTAPAFAQMRF